MTMTPKQIGERLLAITVALVEKIEEQPFIPPVVKVNDNGMCTIALYRGMNNGNYDLGMVSDETFEGVLDKAAEFVASLPSKSDMAKADFQKDLAKLIDKGSEIGIEVEFMNPITAAMKALSENIITDQRAK